MLNKLLGIADLINFEALYRIDARKINNFSAAQF